MNKQELAELLKKLQSELEAGPTVDDKLREQLQTLDQDIRKVLTGQGTAATEDSEGSLEERAQAIEARFASEHPYLANTLRDVMDTLGKMGI